MAERKDHTLEHGNTRGPDSEVASKVASEVAVEQSQERAIKAAMNDVRLPPGLASRIKSAVDTHYRLAPSSFTALPSTASLPSTALQPTIPPMSINGDQCRPDGLDCSQAPLGNRIGASAHTEPRQELEPRAGLELQRAAGPSDDAGASDESLRAGWLRRSVLFLALAAGIGGFAFVARQWNQPTEKSWLAAHSQAILDNVDRDNLANWQRAESTAHELPGSVQSQLKRLAIVAQRDLSALITQPNSTRRGMVYCLDAGDGRGIFLIRMPGLPAVRGMTSRFEILPTASGGWSLAALTVGDETFVLAAACTEQQLFQYAHRPDIT